MVEEDGFEPSKRNATDLQSAPFGHSGIPPYLILKYLYQLFINGGHNRARTCDPLLVRQMLSQLSYAPIYKWWRKMDSNHRSETQQIYSLPPLATREFLLVGAGTRT